MNGDSAATEAQREHSEDSHAARGANAGDSFVARLALGLSLMLVACGSHGTSPDAGVPAPDLAMAGDAGTVPVADAGKGNGGDAGNDGGAMAQCPSPVPADPLATMRTACTFTGGAMPATTIGATGPMPIKHVIVLMKENRSFDHIFGGIKAVQPDAEVFPAGFTNPDTKGNAAAPFHLTTTCVPNDPDHQWDAMHTQVDSGKMDGFVKSAAASTGSDGLFAIGYYQPNDLPFYYFLASTFALGDHHFAAARTGTFPNRDYMLLGTSDKVMSTQFSTWPDPSLPTIFDRLDAAGVSWGVYGDDHPLEETLNNPAKNWEKLHPWQPVQKLLDALAAGTLPSVVFVDATENTQDDHPTADLQQGEVWTKRIYDAALQSSVWSSTALILTYDEGGGFFDHVPPPNACLARPQDTMFFERGVRVPLVAISPWARRHYVSHVPRDHTSITRFIETLFNLPALTARDANADALLDLFDFACPPAAIPAAPAAGSKGCYGNANISVSKTSYAVNESIVVNFSNGPGNAHDWIGVYPKGETPHSGSTLFKYVNDSQTAGAALTQGTVTLGPGSGHWPLAVGQWMAFFLVNESYTPIASVEFDVK